MNDPTRSQPEAPPDAPADTYRRMVDPEAATFETPDAAGMDVEIGQVKPPPDKTPATTDPRVDTYRRMVDPEAATFETPDAVGMDVEVGQVQPPPGKKP